MLSVNDTIILSRTRVSDFDDFGTNGIYNKDCKKRKRMG